MGFPETPTELSLGGSFSTSASGGGCGDCCGGGDEDFGGSLD